NVDYVYGRVTGISGAPLNDSYHLGQTIRNDFGRPFGEGVSGVAGLSGYVLKGPLLFQFRGEYQGAPAVPDEGLAARTLFASQDQNPILPTTAKPAVEQFRLLDTYLSAMLSGWQLSFGKRSLYWGPTQSGPFLYSSNAEP